MKRPMIPTTPNTELDTDVSDVLATIREELGEDEPRLDMTTLDEDVDEDERATGVYYSYMPSDSEMDDGVSIPDVLACAIVYADALDDEAMESVLPTRAAGLDALIKKPTWSWRPIWRTLRTRYFTGLSALAAMLVLLLAVAAWLTWPRPTDLERPRPDAVTAETSSQGR